LKHLLWHGTAGFTHLASLAPTTIETLGQLPLLGLSFLILLAACGKSAQFPFCSWLPRAMEGPTPSSAIFYGALSVHAGVFLLLRMYPLWHILPAARWMVGAVGLITAFVAAGSGRVQSNIKAQIGYASIAQVGLMLVELALGWPTFVLFHFVSNASLRCYQLLVSPSVVAHLLRVQAASPGQKISDWSLDRLIPSGLRSSFYVFAFNEGYLENLLRFVLWTPVRRFARAVHGDEPRRAWAFVGVMALAAAISVRLTNPDSGKDIVIYLSGIVPSWCLGWWALSRLTPIGRKALQNYHGLARYRPRAAILLFFAVLGVAGFPCTPAFIGEDLLMHHTAGDQFWLAAILTGIFVINGLIMIRMYARLCFGPPRWAAAVSAA
jgi:NADH:ubiquinone oxidoreductase subunit 5 (subunit L)/multisubunit Na+/H+ antiporter MnhA subunit